jgi:hypothetical protein
MAHQECVGMGRGGGFGRRKSHSFARANETHLLQCRLHAHELISEASPTCTEAEIEISNLLVEDLRYGLLVESASPPNTKPNDRRRYLRLDQILNGATVNVAVASLVAFGVASGVADARGVAPSPTSPNKLSFLAVTTKTGHHSCSKLPPETGDVDSNEIV